MYKTDAKTYCMHICLTYWKGKFITWYFILDTHIRVLLIYKKHMLLPYKYYTHPLVPPFSYLLLLFFLQQSLWLFCWQKFLSVHDLLTINSISPAHSIRQYVQFTVHDFLFLPTNRVLQLLIKITLLQTILYSLLCCF